MLHWTAWERGVKSLYYCRSKSVQRAGFAGVEADNTRAWPKKPLESDKDENKYDECLACQ
jgi:ribonucleoside-diphosphate reductase alpha chain